MATIIRPWVMLLVVIVSQASFARQNDVATRQQAMDVITQFHTKRAAMQVRHQKQYDAGWSAQLQWKNEGEEETFLLESAVTVESYYRQAPRGEVRAEALSDVEGLKSHISFREGMLNRSGSGRLDDMLEWGQKHFETRMVYYTVRILEYDDNPPVNVNQWLKVMNLAIPEG